MKNIGILTYHNNENRGAILQAYGLCRLLERELNANAEVIEYRTRSKEFARKRPLFITKEPHRIPDRIRDRRIVESFFKNELSTSSNSIVTDDHDEATAWLCEQNYDAVVTGSDEIWKVRESDETGLLSKLSSSRPFPNLYFLDDSIPGVKFSYAASANRTRPETLSEETLEMFRRHLMAYDFISVRDRHTKQLIEDLNIGDVTQVPDPTLMIDIPKRPVEAILEQRSVDLDKPILGFHGSDNVLFKRICEEYRDRGYQIVTPRLSRIADVELRGVVDPFEYYSIYEYFDMVITNSLHSTIFSIKHGTPFATIDTSSVYENIESKTHSLLHEFDMLDRHIDAVDGDASAFIENRNALESEPDKDHIQTRISNLQKRGFDFLDKIEDSL